MKLFLGVDGGQSSTTALIGDDTGRVIALSFEKFTCGSGVLALSLITSLIT